MRAPEAVVWCAALKLFAKAGRSDSLMRCPLAQWVTTTGFGCPKTTLAPTNAKEAAVLIRLEPGNYTTVVDGADNGTGIALVEVFEMDRD